MSTWLCNARFFLVSNSDGINWFEQYFKVILLQIVCLACFISCSVFRGLFVSVDVGIYRVSDHRRISARCRQRKSYRDRLRGRRRHNISPCLVILFKRRR